MKTQEFILFYWKDNIPFHTVIFPAILAGLGIKNPNLRIISGEHLKTLKVSLFQQLKIGLFGQITYVKNIMLIVSDTIYH